MKRAQFVILWQQGLHLRPAAKLVRLAQASKSLIQLKTGERIANARSVLAVLMLCAAVGTVIDLEVSGEDEDTVLASVSRLFATETTEANPDSEAFPKNTPGLPMS